MGQNVIQCTTFMRQFKADADPLCLFQENLLSADHDKAGCIITALMNTAL